MKMNYLLHIIILLEIFVILSVSANMIIGMTNLLTMAQAAFFAIGAYTTAGLLITYNMDFLYVLPLIMIFSGLSALPISAAVLRGKNISGDYFMLITLGFQMIVYNLLYNWVEITNGPYGISGIPSPTFLYFIKLNTKQNFTIFSTLLTLAVILISNALMKSHYGTILKGIRDDEMSVKVLGKRPQLQKLKLFIISSAGAGLAGAVFAGYVRYIDPSSFNLDQTILILTAVLIGGSGSKISGPITGALFVIIPFEFLRFLGIPNYFSANLTQIIYGLLIILLMFIRPWGIAGEERSI